MSEPEKGFGSFREGRGPSGEDTPDFGSFKANLDA